ncbi:E3 ubiquitin-protein ligase RNF128 [Triplophysa tibetana]|uniref:E3 ubiquitin-protein ligase RNF128 n=1 Tax=Triplophysa tibetana TaxID=1572043 RepID=A0A5A9P4U0_9TELE|nr:E3 ubiquitin-protein ligase RNF128 [Triplophysa tibetana]
MGPLAGRDVFSWLLVASFLQVSSVRLAQATYLCTAYLNVSYVEPNTNQTYWKQDEIGLYGQDSPKASVSGRVYLARPIYGCDLNTVYVKPNDTKGWIALIQRGNGCTFSDKINIAAVNGAVAAIIFNDYGTDNRVIQMSHPGTNIIAVMIGYVHGMSLVHLLNRGSPVTIEIVVGKQQRSPWMSHYSVFFVSISFFIVTAATVGYFIFYSARRLNNLRQLNRNQRKRWLSKYGASSGSGCVFVVTGGLFPPGVECALGAGHLLCTAYLNVPMSNPTRTKHIGSRTKSGCTNIIAVMIGYVHGMSLVHLLNRGSPVTIEIVVGKQQRSPWMSHYSVFFVSISFFIVTAATVGYFIFYSARRLNNLRQLNRNQETGPDADTCAVCIELYKPGDVLTILTCNHFFHKSCIEPWLLEHRTCPMCKCDILKALGVEMDVEEQPHISVPDFRSFTISEDLPSETASHTQSETASSGYASSAPEDALNGLRDEQMETPPQYDNLAFERDVYTQNEVRA